MNNHLQRALLGMLITVLYTLIWIVAGKVTGWDTGFGVVLLIPLNCVQLCPYAALEDFMYGEITRLATSIIPCIILGGITGWVFARYSLRKFILFSLLTIFCINLLVGGIIDLFLIHFLKNMNG